MKKIISFILIFALTITSCIFYGCTDNQDSEVTANELLTEKYDMFTELISSSSNNADIAKYLISWASENNINASYDKYSNVIMSSKATVGYEEVPSTIFHCTIDTDNVTQTAVAMSIATHIISSSENHGFMRVLLTSSENGIDNVDLGYLTADNFISLDWNIENSILVGSAGNKYYTIEKDLQWTTPSYNQAYKISIHGLKEADMNDTGNFPNPITIIGHLLASAKSNGIPIEIADFDGGISADTYPSSVYCTILINQKDVKAFKERFKEAKEDFDEEYGEIEDDYVFSFNEVPVPNEVISFEESSQIISFLYTCPDGNHVKDDRGEIIAKSNIGRITTEQDNLEILLCASSKTNDLLAEMQIEFDIICGLCDITYTYTLGDPVWENDSDMPLITELEKAIDKISTRESSRNRVFELTSCAAAKKRVADMNIVGFGVTHEKMTEQSEILMLYLENSNLVDEAINI